MAFIASDQSDLKWKLGFPVLYPTWKIFKTRLDKVLCGLLWVTLLRQEGWT